MALACMTTAWAQRDITFDRELSVGVKGGVTIPNMAFSPSIQQNTWVGYTTGLTFRDIESLKKTPITTVTRSTISRFLSWHISTLGAMSCAGSST